MQEPATAPWGLPISAADLEKLAAGFEPQDQDDKWRISSSSPAMDDQSEKSGSGTIAVHFARSGTREEIYVLAVKPSGSGVGGGGGGNGATIEAITWEQNKGGIRISEEQGKKEAAIISRRVLECEIEALPEYDNSVFWTHPGAQLGAN